MAHSQLLSLVFLLLSVSLVSCGFSGVSYGITISRGGSSCGYVLCYGGYQVTIGESESWCMNLYKTAKLDTLGITNIVAIQGPRDPSYNGREMGNSELVSHLNGAIKNCKGTQYVLTIGHSSGSYVAHEFLNYLMQHNAWKDRVVYYNIEGGLSGFSASGLAHHFFGSARKGSLTAPNYSAMKSSGGRQFIELNGGSSGCYAEWCLHTFMITTHPRNGGGSSPTDYIIDESHPVQIAYLSRTWNYLKALVKHVSQPTPKKPIHHNTKDNTKTAKSSNPTPVVGNGITSNDDSIASHSIVTPEEATHLPHVHETERIQNSIQISVQIE